MTARDSPTDELLSGAVIAHLGKGRSAFPVSDDEAVLRLAGDHGADVLQRVSELEDEMMAVGIDWDQFSLTEGDDQARSVLADRHPELSPAALDALRWMFTYNWR